MRIKILVLGLVSLFLFGCAMLRLHQLSYSISLVQVERPSEAKERYGEQKIFKTEEEGYNYAFEDDMIKILWLPTSSKMGFLLNNKTDHTIKIMWDEGAYVDENGRSHRIMHSGIKYSEREQAQPPSVIVRKGSLSDVIIPTDYVVFEYSKWEEKPILLDNQMGGDFKKLLENSKKYIGKTIQVLLPIQIEDTTNDYIFTFKVNDVKYIGFRQY